MSAIMRSRNGVMVVSSRDRSRGRTALPSTKGYQEASGSATAPLSCGGAAPFNRRSQTGCGLEHQGGEGEQDAEDGDAEQGGGAVAVVCFKQMGDQAAARALDRLSGVLPGLGTPYAIFRLLGRSGNTWEALAHETHLRSNAYDLEGASNNSPLTNRAGAESMHVSVVQFET